MKLVKRRLSALTSRSTLDILAERLEGIGRPRIAILVDRPAGGVASSVRQAFPDAVVTKVRMAGTKSDLHVALAAAGPFDAMLDHTRRPAVRGRRFKSTFFHLRPGGSYIVEGYASQERSLGDGKRAKALGTLLARLERAKASNSASGRKHDDLGALARAVESVSPVGDHLVVVSRARALAKLREEEATAVLKLRGHRDRILETVPGEQFASRCRYTSSTGERPSKMPDVYDAPDMHLREYKRAVCVPGQVLTKGNLLLPDTYRHNQSRRLTNKYTQELGPRFATVEYDADRVDELDGTYFYLDSEVRGHFGHAITEQLSRLWALPLARKVAPDLKAVMAIKTRQEIQPFEVELYGAAGLAPEELVLLHEPGRVERLLAATPMFSMPEYVHPDIRHTWQRVGDVLESGATVDQIPERMFISRRIRKRACLNTGEVEELFAKHGFAIVYPEDYRMADQVAMFRHAKVIAGFAGSGLFNVCFASEKKQLIMLHHAAYSATNEYQMASVLGHDIDAVISDVDPDSELNRNVKRFQSSFTVDFDREGRYLARALADL